MNVGTKINLLIKSQGFDHHNPMYPGRTSSYSTKTGLQIMMFAYTSNATHYDIDQQPDGNYTISTGLKHSTATTLVSDIAEENVAKTFMQIISEKMKEFA
jgi:hypothetical protein